MKITSILSATAIVLAAAAGQGADASGVQAVYYSGAFNAINGVVYGSVTAADVAQARQHLAALQQRNRHESEKNTAQRYAQWLREQAAAASRPAKQPSTHPHKQPASDEGSESDSGSDSSVSTHRAGLPHPHPHPHKQHKQHKQHGHHHFHHSASGSSSGSGHFVAEVAAPHATVSPARIHHLNKKHDVPTKHQTAELHAVSDSSSSSVDVGSDDSNDSDDVVFPSSADTDSNDADDSDDEVSSVSSSPASHAGDATAGLPASTLTGEAPVAEASSSRSAEAPVEIKPHLPKNLRHPEHLSHKDTSEAATKLAESKSVESVQGSTANASNGPAAVVAVAGIVAGVIGVIVAAVGFRRVRRSDARYGASELIVDLPDPESVGNEDDCEDDALALEDAAASTTNALDEADSNDLLKMQSPFPRADEVGEFTNA